MGNFENGCSSFVVEKCQICDETDLRSILFLGYLPPVNEMPIIGSRPKEQASFPAQFLYCKKCTLVQLGLAVSPTILFPAEYPYTSSTTKILRDNFADLYQEVMGIYPLKKEDLVVDIGSNDGNLLSNFQENHQVYGITPEDIGKIAIKRGIPTLLSYFNESAVDQILQEKGPAKIVTATNVFAHIDNVHQVIKDLLKLMDSNGIFISESHYLLALVETVQYDTIYHEHLRYYSLTALQYLLKMHDLEIFHAKRIPTHGGSIRVYASKSGTNKIQDSVAKILEEEKNHLSFDQLLEFNKKVVSSKLQLMRLLDDLKQQNKTIVGISAPSRATTLINYVGLDENIIESVMEIKGSHKIGKYVPGTLIPVLDETALYEEQPDYALLFSWHIAKELMNNLRKRGYKGDFIVPLPIPMIIGSEK